MGGTNSGRRPKSARVLVEEAIHIDIRALKRLGVVRAGECVIGTVRWSKGTHGVAEARVRVDLSDPNAGSATVTIFMPDGVIKQRMPIEAVPCRFGGHRFYLICPVTGRRCEVLYLASGRFASREAHGLTYVVQSLDRMGRVRRRSRKLRDRLDGKGLMPRPRGDRRYRLAERLREMLEEERAALRVAAADDARRAK